MSSFWVSWYSCILEDFFREEDYYWEITFLEIILTFILWPVYVPFFLIASLFIIVKNLKIIFPFTSQWASVDRVWCWKTCKFSGISKSTEWHPFLCLAQIMGSHRRAESYIQLLTDFLLRDSSLNTVLNVYLPPSPRTLCPAWPGLYLLWRVTCPAQGPTGTAIHLCSLVFVTGA